LAGALADAGHAVISLEYRRIPGDPDAMVGDVAMALAAISAHEVTLIGHSAGGHLALWAAANISKVKKVIALAPVSDLQMTEVLHLDEGAAADFLGCPASTRPDLDPMHLEYGDVEVIVVQGDSDIRVPVEMNRSFSQRHTRVKYLEFPDIGHFEVIDPTNVLWMKEAGKFL
jgi:acetyl esterase/lipase